MDLGTVFAGVPRVGGRVDGCTYCYSESDLELLGGDPADVPDSLVSSFAREVIDHWSEDHRLETLICAAAHIDHDLAPWLLYLDTLGPDADAAIAEVAEYWATGGEPMLWWFPEDPAAPIRDWLHSDVLWDRLSRAKADDVKIAIARM
ncbi:hypothetical protein [Kibdelosporangium aridum]|nr:hypothetical protein [Kibdelosporangium aridum]